MLKKINLWWESLCNGCGLCCYEKQFNEDIVFIDMENPCKYLNCNNNSCSIYNERFEINPNCKKVTLYEALFNPYLPGSCGYVKKVRFWKRRKNV